MAKIRVLTVDDSVTIRAIMGEIFASDDEFELVGEAPEAQSAMRMIDELMPDVVTIDIAMPGMDGLALLDHVVANTQTNAVMLSARVEAMGDAYNRGAHGFFDKARMLREPAALRALIKRAAAGKYEECDAEGCDPKIAATNRRVTVRSAEARFG